MKYIDKIDEVAKKDVEEIKRKDAEYGGSWKRRGGVGAFMMLARKWDRIEEQVKKANYDIFTASLADSRDEGLLDDIRDLRRYLTLVEAEVLCSETSLAAVHDFVYVINRSTGAPTGYWGKVLELCNNGAYAIIANENDEGSKFKFPVEALVVVPNPEEALKKAAS